MPNYCRESLPFVEVCIKQEKRVIRVAKAMFNSMGITLCKDITSEEEELANEAFIKCGYLIPKDTLLEPKYFAEKIERQYCDLNSRESKIAKEIREKLS